MISCPYHLYQNVTYVPLLIRNIIDRENHDNDSKKTEKPFQKHYMQHNGQMNNTCIIYTKYTYNNSIHETLKYGQFNHTHTKGSLITVFLGIPRFIKSSIANLSVPKN